MKSENLALVMAHFSSSIPQGETQILVNAIKDLPDSAMPAIMAVQIKSTTVTLVLSLLIGALGVDRFYLGDIGLGVAKLLLGWLTLGIWPLIDIFFSFKRAKTVNMEKIMQTIMILKNRIDAPSNGN